MTKYADMMEYMCPGCKMESNSWAVIVAHAKQAHDIELLDEP